MIQRQEPLSMVEAIELLKKSKAENPELAGFAKKFASGNMKEAQRIRESLEALNLLKVKLEHIVKIIELMPENATDLNKIFVDVSLDEDETKKILEVIKQNK